MNLAILFWFYKEPEICENRLRLLKKYNPDLKIYGLFGGDKAEASQYQKRLGKYLDDFYTFESSKDTKWKWIHGDLMILDWFDKRGRDLEWGSVAVVQWDMLVLDSLKKQFSGMKEGEIFISGLRMIDKEVENKWSWTEPGSKDRKNFDAFLDYINKEYGYVDEPLCSLFIFEIFPRIFFEKYLTVKNKEVGMLEYKVPLYAKIFGIPYYKKDIGVLWFSDKLRPLNAIPTKIEKKYIEDELSREDGWRIFHPYFEKWDL